MRLIDDWHWVMRKAWSVKLILLAGILSGMEAGIDVLVTFQVNTWVPPGVLAAGAAIISFLALVLRFFAQSRD